MDPVARQHRVRIWWTIYICDRMWGSKSGHPLMIPDRDITVDLPSFSGLSDEERTAFPDPDHIIASIKLAKIAGNIITTVYCRGHPPPFIQSVQKVLGDLNAWMAALPDSIRLAETASCTSRHVVSLHLSFNQVCRKLLIGYYISNVSLILVCYTRNPSGLTPRIHKVSRW